MSTITVNAPMTGRVIEVLVSDGDTVSQGDVLVVVESMKMENEILSEHEGLVSNLRVAELETISEDDPILDIETG